MANKNLTDLTARTATAGSDLIHVNSGGTDYKETKANFLQDVNSSISSLNSSLANNSIVDGCRVITKSGNWRYVRVKFTGADTSFYGVLFIVQYGVQRSCIANIKPAVSDILPLGSSTPTATYSYSDGVATTVQFLL